MKILIITAPERRARYRFISKPLERGVHEPEILVTKPVAGFIAGLSRLLGRNRPDLVIAMGVGLKELVVCLIARARGIVVLARLGGDPVRDKTSIAGSLLKNGRYFAWLKYRINLVVARMCLRMLDGLIVVNETLSNNISARTGRKIPAAVVPQYCSGGGVPREYRIADPVEVLTVVNLRYLEKARGVIWLIERLGECAADSHAGIRLRVAGSGQHLADIQSYLTNAKLPPGLEVVLEGHIADLHEHYIRADMFLYRSLHDATPNVILESKKYALPLMINDCNEFRSIVENQVSGFLYGNDREFRDLFHRLLADESLRTALGRAAMNEHERLYSVASIQSRLETALSEFVRLPRTRDNGLPRQQD